MDRARSPALFQILQSLLEPEGQKVKKVKKLYNNLSSNLCYQALLVRSEIHKAGNIVVTLCLTKHWKTMSTFNVRFVVINKIIKPLKQVDFRVLETRHWN